MVLVLKRRGRHTDREDAAEESTPAEPPHSTLRLYSVIQQFSIYSPPPDAVITTVIPDALTGTVGGHSHVTQAEHSRTRTSSISSHIFSSTFVFLCIYALDWIGTVMRAAIRNTHGSLSTLQKRITASMRRPRYATAADIPSELYDLILYFMDVPRKGDNHQGEQEGRNRIVVRKHELGQLGLVCWSWAGMCQVKLYEVVTLRSLENFRELEMLASHPCSRISQYIQHLQLYAYNESRPWIHTVCLKVCPRAASPERVGSPFPNYEGHILGLNGNNALAALKRGLHAALPRQVPSRFSQGITQLNLYDMELPGIGEVVRLSRALPELQLVVFWDVAWVATPSTEAEAYASLVRRRSGKKHPPATRVDMVGCAEAWVGLPLLFLLDTTRPLCADDLSAVARIAQTLTVSIEKAHSAPLTLATRVEWGCRLSMSAPWDRVLAPYLLVTTAHDAALGLWRTSVISFECVPYKDATMLELSEMAGYDWESFDKHAASLPALRHVIFGLASLDDLVVFVKVIEPKMPLLRTSRRLKCALWSKVNNLFPVHSWVACTPPRSLEPSPPHSMLDDLDPLSYVPQDVTSAKRVVWDKLHTLYS